ncbi:hypothetical protein V494_07957, partial [Pseudogymnoascus sp. VKM F-4513 (FW-928)]
LPTSATL